MRLDDDDLDLVGGDGDVGVVDQQIDRVERRHQGHHPERAQAGFHGVVEVLRRRGIALQEPQRALHAAGDFGGAQHGTASGREVAVEHRLVDARSAS